MHFLLIGILTFITLGLWCCLKAASIQDNEKK